VRLNFKNLPAVPLKLDWNDNWAVFAGVQRQLDEHWTARFGLGWQTAAIPKSTSSPITPDVDGWVAACGLGYKKNDWEINVAFARAEGRRRVSYQPFWQNISPGVIKAEINIVSVSFSRHF